jgi:predicted CXXCH cytochrome family protein
MNQTGLNAVPPTRRRTGPLLSVVLLVIALWLLLSGCGSPEQRYRVLSFFFDGVPNPNAPAATQPRGTAIVSRRPGGPGVVVYSHQPYAQNKCDSCHVGAGASFESFAMPQRRVCLNCHPGVTRQYPVMHGPVVNLACLFCHSPHESTLRHLLDQPAPGLCLQCHARADLPDKPAEHRDPKADCLTCHVAHGSNRHGLLRPGIPTWEIAATTTMATTAPAHTQPDTAAAPTTQAATEP